MISPLDARTRQFYMEMGYSEQQVARAHEYAVLNKLDILDVLAMQLSSSSQPSPQPAKSSQNPANVSSSSKALAGSFLRPMSQVRGGEYETLFSRSSKFSAGSARSEVREASQPVGLLNISNCCYLNSLLQCYFLMDKFKRLLLTAEPLPDLPALLSDNRTKLKRLQGEYELLAQLKRFFTTMALTSRKYLDPSQVLQNLVDSVGEKLAYGEEKDLSEINIMIIERLSEGLTFTKRFYREREPLPEQGSFIDESADKQDRQDGRRDKYASIFNPETGVIKQLFYGTKVEYYEAEVEEQPIVSDFAGIILNPRFGTLERALDEQFNFSVEMRGQRFQKRMFIREQPEYLFLYINRTEFDREEQQLQKNEQKFAFDFLLYLDPYMERYRQERSQNDERRRALVHRRNTAKEQLATLSILAEKMQECYSYARELEGWAEKLPSQEEFEAEGHRLRAQLAEVQRELEAIESRREEYHLMYIFVHRGDAVSGHYWGYGRNGEQWCRFDVNCRLIPQDQILIDIEKSAGTPYALLYVKQHNIPQLRYGYHLRPHLAQHEPELGRLFEEKLAEEIVRDNILLHQEVQARNHEIIRKKCLADYLSRFNALKKAIKRTRNTGQRTRLDSLPLANNFSLFLHSKDELQLYKFSIFQQSLLTASNGKVTIERLMQEGELLAAIQKKFKLKCKGELHLKNYAMVGKDLERYLKLQQEYQLAVFEVAWTLLATAAYERLHSCLEKLNLKGEFVRIDIDGGIAAGLQEVVWSLRVRNALLRSEQYEKAAEKLEEFLYISQVNNEITNLIMLRLVLAGFRFESLQKFVDLGGAAGAQIAAINSANAISLSAILENPSSLSAVEEAQELVRMFFAQSVDSIRKGSVADSASKADRRSSSKASNSFEAFSSSATSPFKSSAFRVSSQKRASESKLSTFAKTSILFLDGRQTWKIEEMETMRGNFDLPVKVLGFLRKAGPVVKLYRRAMQLSRALSLSEMCQMGLALNQPRVEPESLI